MIVDDDHARYPKGSAFKKKIAGWQPPLPPEVKAFDKCRKDRTSHMNFGAFEEFLSALSRSKRVKTYVKTYGWESKINP
jgi:hypothetical protein